MKTAQEIGNAAIRQAIEDGLAECTQAQRDQFTRIYPDLPDSKLANAHDLIQRTLRKNESGRVNV